MMGWGVGCIALVRGERGGMTDPVSGLQIGRQAWGSVHTREVRLVGGGGGSGVMGDVSMGDVTIAGEWQSR